MVKRLIESSVRRWVMLSRRYWIAVLVLAAISAVVGVEYVHERLGINTNTADMISRKLEWRQRDIDFNHQFPQFTDTLVVVIDGDSPDLVNRAAAGLSRELMRNKELITGVQRPGHSAFFERNAFLYLDTAELARLADDLSAGQPLLERLSRDPSLFAVAQLFDDAINARDQFKSDSLDRFSTAVVQAIDAVLAGRFYQLSWQRLMSADATAAA